jgi:hypothetical protein
MTSRLPAATFPLAQAHSMIDRKAALARAAET